MAERSADTAFAHKKRSCITGRFRTHGTVLHLAAPPPAQKRRRRCALPAHSIIVRAESLYKLTPDGVHLVKTEKDLDWTKGRAPQRERSRNSYACENHHFEDRNPKEQAGLGKNRGCKTCAGEVGSDCQRR